MKKVLIAIAVGLLAAVGYYGFGQYQQTKLVESLVPHIKNASLRVANTTRFETDADTKITYKELFEKLEADISELDKRVLEVQTLATPETSETTDPAVAYLKSSQELLRALLQKYRKSLAFSSAMSWAEKQLDEYRESSGYGVEYAKRSADKAIKDLSEAEREMKASIPDVVATAQNLKVARGQLAKRFPADALVLEVDLEKLVEKNKAGPEKK